MRTIISKTSSKGNSLEIAIDGMCIVGIIDGQQQELNDSIVLYTPPVQVGDVLVAGYLHSAKIGLTRTEIALIKATKAANRRMIVANQPFDLLRDMSDNPNSAF